MNLFFFILDLLGILSNGLTQVYIFKSFDTRINVFALIFSDASFSVICCVIASAADLLMSIHAVESNVLLCNLTSTVVYLPSMLGAVLTLEVAVIRHYLASEAAQCRYPSNVKVTATAVTFSFLYVIAILGMVTLFVYFDIPYSVIVESCLRPEGPPRPMSIGMAIFLQMPNIVNIVSLIVDLKLLRLLRKNSLPVNNLTLGTIADKREPSIIQEPTVVMTVPESGAPGSQEMIPIRGTILSASFFVPYIFLFLMFKTIPVDKASRVFWIKFVISIILIIRCPLTALTTYKFKPSNSVHSINS